MAGPIRPREAETARLLVDWLTRRGLAVHRRNVAVFPAEYQGRRRWIRCGAKGQSDYWFLMCSGRHVELEVKRPGERPTLDQIAWLLATNARGGLGLWVSSLETLQRIMPILWNGGHIFMNHDGAYMADDSRTIDEALQHNGDEQARLLLIRAGTQTGDRHGNHRARNRARRVSRR